MMELSIRSLVFRCLLNFFKRVAKLWVTLFFVHDLQEKEFREAGFVDINVIDHKVCDLGSHVNSTHQLKL